MSLKVYQKKRKFEGKKKTSEPKGKLQKISSHIRRDHKFKGKIIRRKPIRLSRFVIHEHHASRLHWDLRLEMNGVLKSWAVPKIPSKAKGIKRLAMHVEDHPLAYISFHGTIPEGSYGAGKVIIWDKGTYNLLEKTSKKIIIDIKGKKLNGRYALIKTSYGGKKNGWLFFKI